MMDRAESNLVNWVRRLGSTAIFVLAGSFYMQWLGYPDGIGYGVLAVWGLGFVTLNDMTGFFDSPGAMFRYPYGLLAIVVLPFIVGIWLKMLAKFIFGPV